MREDDDVFDVWCAREEIVWLSGGKIIFFGEHGGVASLRDWVAGHVDDALWLDFEEFLDEFGVATGAWWIEDDGAIWRNVIGDVFGFSENAVGVRAGGVVLHFFKGGAINFDESQIFVARDGEADATDAGIEVEDFVTLDVFGDLLEREFINWQIDLEETVWRIGIALAEEAVFECLHDWMRLTVLEEGDADFARLIAARHDGLVFASFGMLGIELVDEFLGGGKNLWALNAALGDRNFAMRAALMESEENLVRVVIPVERVLHFVAIAVIFAVGNSWQNFDIEVVLCEAVADDLGFDF